jgi:hypothetical protein
MAAAYGPSCLNSAPTKGTPVTAKRKPRIDPDAAHDRAVRAALARSGPDYHARKLAEAAGSRPAAVEAAIRRLIAEWPPLGPHQRERLARLLDLRGDDD